MITKAYIIRKPDYNSTKFLVRIPIFETPGSNENSSLTSSEFEATLCYSPGNLEGYRVGDCVYVTFEDNTLNRPIIIGKLYLGVEETPTTYQVADTLKVTSLAKLPENTVIGDISYTTLLDIIKQQDVIIDRLSRLENAA